MSFFSIDFLRTSFQSFYSVWCNEFKQVFKDIGVVIFFIVVPLVYPLLYGYIYNNEVVREVPVVAVDLSRSSLSRTYLRKVNATPDVTIKSYCANLQEAQELLKKHEAYGIIYIPEDFSKNLHKGEQAIVKLFSDMSGLLYYKALVLSNTAVSLAMNESIKIQRSHLTTSEQEKIMAYPIAYKEVALFNPTTGFASFLIPAVLILMIQQTLLLGVGLLAGTNREKNAFKKLIPIHRHYKFTLPIVLGKAFCYFICYIFVSIYILGIVPAFFSLACEGSIHTLILFMLPYLLACIFFAMTLSLFVHYRETSMLLFVFTSVPLLFISGISWPGAAIPEFWRYISYLFPSTFGINGYVKINEMGATLSQVSFEYYSLWVQAFIYALIASLVYRQQVAHSRKQLLLQSKQI